MKQLFNLLLFMSGACGAGLLAQEPLVQDAGEGETERVQYTLILPDEKTPELIRPEENNPFQIAVDESKNEGDTEENRIRDILLAMPAKGGGYGPDGMRVMLGSMRLVAGQMVPDVLPDQEVKLKVKSITPSQIELVWVEKKPTGLPPKPFVINVDVSPRVRYQMPAGVGEKGVAGGGIGTVRMEGMSAFSRSQEPVEASPEARGAAAEEPQPQTASRAEPVQDDVARPAESPPAPSSHVPEASVLRMLFGKHAQKK
jgi:hypothetical protein